MPSKQQLQTRSRRDPRGTNPRVSESGLSLPTPSSPRASGVQAEKNLLPINKRIDSKIQRWQVLGWLP